MKPMREISLWLLGNGLLLGGLSNGLINGVDGALNVGLFMVWMRVVLSPFSLMRDTQQRLAKTGPGVVPRLLSAVATSIALGLLVWHGYVFTAGLFLFATVCMAHAQDEAEKLRRAAA